jgi:hypothetical protein
MASGNTIIVGGGIASASPFTVGAFPVVVNADPATVSDGNIRQDTSTPPKVFIGDASLTAGATVLGGATCTLNATDAIVIGNGASITATALATFASVVIGAGAIGGLGNGNVVIGEAATAAGSGATASDSVSIGRGAGSINPSGGANNVCIGAASVISLGSQQVCIGSSASISANNQNVAIGNAAAISGGAGTASCIVIGPNSATSQSRSICIGTGITNNQAVDAIIIGTSFTTAAGYPTKSAAFLASAGITTFLIGKGDAVVGATDNLLFRMTNQSGANAAGGSLTLQSGLGTGTGASSVINLASSIPIGAGSTLQTSRTGFRMSPSVTAGQTDIMVYDVDNATLERVTVGAADSGGVGFKVLRIPN